MTGGIEAYEVLTTYGERLLELCPVGATIYNVLEHRSESGMTRWIKSYVIHDGELVWISGYIRMTRGEKRHAKYDGTKEVGCGMDMGFHLVYELSYELHGDSYALNARWL